LISVFLTTFGWTNVLQLLKRLMILVISWIQFRPAMRTGWLAYIKKTYSADAVQHGPALGQGELVVGDDE
jgi:hypothetical protein